MKKLEEKGKIEWAKRTAKELGVRFRTFKVFDESFTKELGRVTVARRKIDNDKFVVSLAYIDGAKKQREHFSKGMGQYWAMKFHVGNYQKKFIVTDPSLDNLKDLVTAYSEMKNIKWMKNSKHII
jgi:hypothetical protein